jgi:uncharacterized protein (TIGR02231 family)
MNLKIYCALTGIVVASAFCAEVKIVPSSVTAVTVYTDRAAVTRMGHISLQSGNYLLSFNNLPVNILDQSVRVSGEAVGAKILDVRVETAFLDTIPEERIRALQAKVQELQAQVNEFNDRIGILNTEREFLAQIKAQTADNISKDLKVQRPTVEDWQKVISFFDVNLTKNFAEQRKIIKDRGDLQNKIDALQRQINQISPGFRRTVKNILVEVQVMQAGELRIFPAYVVVGAQWRPHYDVRVSMESQDVELKYHALIQQSTGEDWINADLSLSTARPDVGGVKPELFPWYLAVAQPVGMLQRKAASGAMSMDALPLTAIQPERALAAMEAPVAEIETQATSALFHILAKSTIPSDNVPHKATIAIEKLHADFSYSSTPKLSPYVYLKAVIKNTTAAPLLAGSAAIFSNDDYVATSSLKMISPNETFDAYLGIDPAIKIERKLINKFIDYTGTFTKNVRVTYEFNFMMENTKKLEQKVLVQDQIPISQNEKIVVEQVEPAEKDMRRDDQGLMNWNLAMKPAEKKSWKLKFNVEYPQGMTVSGLE